MKLSMLALSAGIVLALAQSAAGSNAGVNVTLNGTCTYENHDSKIGTTLWSIVTCDATGACACRGTTKLVLHTEAKYPATAPGGLEKGSITATTGAGSVTLTLAVKRESNLKGTGSWTLGKVSGYGGVKFRKQGTYAAATRELSNIVGTTSSKVQIKATVACWYCG